MAPVIRTIRINGVCVHSVEIVIHFGINPVNGGIPLNDRSMSGTKSCIRGDIKLSLLN